MGKLIKLFFALLVSHLLLACESYEANKDLSVVNDLTLPTPTVTPTPSLIPSPTQVPVASATPTATPTPSTAATPTPVPTGIQTFDTEADWLHRSTRAGVYYKQNFKDFADTTAMRNAKVIGYSTANDSAGNIMYETKLATGANCLSGGKCLEINTYSHAGSQGGGWGQNYKNGASVNGFYFQFSVRMTRNELTWLQCGRDSSGVCKTVGGSKVINMEQYGSGQVTVIAGSNTGFMGTFINGAPGVKRYINNGYNNYYSQTAINNPLMTLNPVPGLTTDQIYARKYGQPQYYRNSSIDKSYNSTNASLNRVDNRGYAWPDPDALMSGAVPWNFDGWTTIQIYIHNDTSGSAGDRLKVWAAHRGQAPTKIIDFDITGDGSIVPSGLIGNGSNYYTQFEILNQNTDRDPEPNYRPTIQRHYSELIGSSQWIPFPGHPNVEEPQ